jgi:hypothetical protein
MLDPNTGSINGTPTQAGTFNFTAQATDSDNPPRTHNRPLSLTINAAPPAPLVITTSTLPNGVKGAVWNGEERPAIYISPNKLSVRLRTQDLAASRSHAVTVRNPDGRTADRVASFDVK